MTTKIIQQLCEMAGYKLTGLVFDKTILVELNNNTILLEGLSFQDTCNQIENLI